MFIIKSEKSPVRIIISIILITFTGKVLGLVREIQIGAALGVTSAGAAFNLATAIPRNFLDIAFASAISGCFIPIFNHLLEKDGKDAAFKLANVFVTFIILIAAGLTVIAVIFRGNLAYFLGPGNSPDTRALTAELFLITLPIIVAAALAFSLIGILQSFGEFNIPAAMSIVSNGVIIIYCVFFVDTFGVTGLAYVFLIGWILQILIQIPPLKKTGYKFCFSFDFRNPALREIRLLILPVMISTWVMPVNDMVNIGISTLVSESASVAYSKANVLYSVITGVFVLSVSNYIFPALTKKTALRDDVGFNELMGTTTRCMVFFLAPMSVGLFILALPVTRLIFLVGLFDQSAVLLTARALKFFCVGMIGFGLQTIFARAFYAQKNAVAPLVTGIAACVLNAVLSMFFKDLLGVGGIALSASVSFCFLAFIMFVILWKKNIIIGGIFSDLLKIVFSVALMGIILTYLRNIIAAALPDGKIYDFFCIFALALAGVIIYFFAALVLRVKEAVIARDMLLGIIAPKPK